MISVVCVSNTRNTEHVEQSRQKEADRNWEETRLSVRFLSFTHTPSIRMRNVITNESVSERAECHSWRGIWLGISLPGLARCLCVLMWLSTSPLRSHY